MRRFRRHPGAWIGSGIVLTLLLVAAFAPLLADRSPTRQDLRARLRPPSAEQPFGTDEFGRSMYARVLTAPGCRC
jgi:peptide/nickel transport system permease protein